MAHARRRSVVILSIALTLAVAAWADTFKNRETGATLDGTLLGKYKTDGQQHYYVKTETGERVSLATTEWEVVKRSATICIIEIRVPLETQGVDEEVRCAINRSEWHRPDVIVFEIDTPGGLVAYAEGLCKRIENIRGPKTVAFVSGGEHRGAFSAGALVAMACDSIYIAKGASIGAATPFLSTPKGPLFTEKMTSALAAKFRSVAERHGHPPLIAGAMVDPDIELREVTLRGKRQLTAGKGGGAPIPAGAELGPWITRKGKLLTLTAAEALRHSLADGVAASRAELARSLGLGDAKIVELPTTRSMRAWLTAGAISAEFAASLRLALRWDPAQYEYEMVQRIVEGFYDSQGNYHPGHSYTVFADGGRLWRYRAEMCAAYIDKCLGLIKEYLQAAQKARKLKVDRKVILRCARELKQWKQGL